MNENFSDEQAAEDNQDTQGLPELPGQVDVLAEDWSTRHTWYALKEHAEAKPATFALCAFGWREAAPEKNIIGFAVRCALMAEISTRAVRQLGAHAHLERIGIWPSSQHIYERVPAGLSRVVLKVLELIEWFSAEDEESLQALLRACRRELQATDVCGKPGAISRDTVERYLRDAERKARLVMNALSGLSVS